MKKLLLFCTAFFLGNLLINSQTLISSENFETDGEGSRYTSNTFQTGCSDYFTRMNNTPATYCVTTHPTNPSGTFYWGTEDSDAASGGEGIITFNAVSFVGYSKLDVDVLIAVGRPNDLRLEPQDYIIFEYNIDAAGWNQFGAFYGNNNGIGLGNLQQDTDLDGAFDASGIEIVSSNFTDVNLEALVSGTSLQVRVRVLANTGTEEILFDNLRISGLTTASSPTVTTTAASAVANTSVTLAGNVTANGGETVTERGIVYAKTAGNANPTIGGSDVTKDTNGTGTGVFSESITNLSAGTQYSFKAYAINSVGTSYGATTTFTTTGKGWIGATNTDWDTNTNWSPNSVPISTDNLVIPNVANKPLITSIINAAANNITIDASSSITIKAGGKLTLEGNLIQNGTFSIASDINAIGSLIVKGTHTGSGTVDYGRYVTTSGTATQGWHLVSSPVNGKNIDDFYGDLVTNGTKRGVGEYVNTNPLNTKWSYYTTGDTPGFFTNGKGYTIKKSITGLLSFNGFLNTSNVTIQVDATGDNNNAIGNPFTSYINGGTFLDNVSAGRLTEKTIWFWDEAGNGGAGEYITSNIAAAYKIAPGQGFFVQALATGNVTFSEDLQTHVGGNTFLKQENRPEIKLFVEDGTNTKTTQIFYIENKTTDFDDGFDSSMFNGFTNPFAVYTQLISNNQGKNLAIQTLPNSDLESMIIPVGINAIAGKEITISLNAANFSSAITIYLEDRFTNTFTRLDEANSNYKITLTENLNGIGRFYLHTSEKALSISDEVALDAISVYKLNATTLKLTGLPQGNTSFKLFSILGKKVMNATFISNGVSTVSLPKLATGIYIVQLETENGKLTKKIILE